MDLKKQLVLLVTCLSFTSVSFASELIVPEEVIASWGYKTVGTPQGRQNIKRIKGEKWSNNRYYYPRFTLSRKCFASDASATEEDERIREEHSSDYFGGAKTYYDSFVYAKCLYSIMTSANKTYLDYQPGVLVKYKKYINTKKTLPSRK